MSAYLPPQNTPTLLNKMKLVPNNALMTGLVTSPLHGGLFHDLFINPHRTVSRRSVQSVRDATITQP